LKESVAAGWKGGAKSLGSGGHHIVSLGPLALKNLMQPAGIVK
jgi:hypothetical protein